MSWINEAYKQIEISGGSAVNADTLGNWLYSNASQIWCTLPTPKTALANYTWKEIKQLGDALSAGAIDRTVLETTYHITIGATKTVIIDNEEHQCRLVGILHDQAAFLSDNNLGFTFELVDLMSSNSPMWATGTQTQLTWTNTVINSTILQEEFLLHTDPELLAVITPAAKHCANSVSQGTPSYWYPTLFWIMSEQELSGASTYVVDNCVEGTQYEYYLSHNYVKTQGSSSGAAYWLRSPSSLQNNVAFFACVTAGGSVSYNRVSTTLVGYCPCFCIGQASRYTLNSIISGLSEGAHILTFVSKDTGGLGTSTNSNKLYIYKGSSPEPPPTEEILFLTADGGSPTFEVLTAPGSSTYEALSVQGEGNTSTLLTANTGSPELKVLSTPGSSTYDSFNVQNR